MAKMLTAKAMEKLRQVAKNLPPIPCQRKVTERGKHLIRRGIYKGKDGKDIDPKATYTSFVTENTDHLEKLKKIYQEQGDDGVTKYAGETVRVYARLQQDLRKQEEQKKTEKVI